MQWNFYSSHTILIINTSNEAIVMSKTRKKDISTPEEYALELLEMKKVLELNHLSHHAEWIDSDVYINILKHIRDTSAMEGSAVSADVPLNDARLYAIKLSLLFGTERNILEYLQRFKKQNPSSRQMIHDACLFTFPDGIWNVSLWRSIVNHNHPSEPNDYILRILALSTNIESAINSNRESIINDIRIQVSSEFEEKFSQIFDNINSNSYEKFKKDYIDEQLKSKDASIKKETEKEFLVYLRQELILPSTGKIDVEDSVKLNNRRASPTPEDSRKYDEILSTIQAAYRKKIDNKFTQEFPDISNLSKHKYIEAQLKKKNKIITAILESKTKAILSSTTPISVIRQYARTVVYKRASEHPDAAQLFFDLGMSEASFNKYLTLKPADDDVQIPNVHIEGVQLKPEYSGYYIKKLSSFDPRAAVLGKLTSCCQSLGNVGEDPVIQGITDECNGFYVLCKKGGSDTILAQCWAWRSTDGRLVFDSIESKSTFLMHHTKMINDFYSTLAIVLTERHGIPSVLVGTSGNTPQELKIVAPSHYAVPIRYDGYRDSSSQCLLADKQFNMRNIHDHRRRHVITKEYIESHKFDYINYILKGMKIEMLERTILSIFSSNTNEFISSLVRREDCKQIRTEDGKTLLHLALIYNRHDYVIDMVKNGYDVNAEDDDGKKPISYLYIPSAPRTEWSIRRFLAHSIHISAPKNIDDLMIKFSCIPLGRRVGFALENNELIKNTHDVSKLLVNFTDDQKIEFNEKFNITPLIKNFEDFFTILRLIPTSIKLQFIIARKGLIHGGDELCRILIELEDKKLQLELLNEIGISDWESYIKISKLFDVDDLKEILNEYLECLPSDISNSQLIGILSLFPKSICNKIVDHVTESITDNINEYCEVLQYIDPEAQFALANRRQDSVHESEALKYVLSRLTHPAASEYLASIKIISRLDKFLNEDSQYHSSVKSLRSDIISANSIQTIYTLIEKRLSSIPVYRQKSIRTFLNNDNGKYISLIEACNKILLDHGVAYGRQHDLQISVSPPRRRQ